MGLHLELFSGLYKYEAGNLLDNNIGSGFKIAITNHLYLPIYREDFIPIQTVTCTYIAMKKVKSIDLPPPYSDCKYITGADSIFYEEFKRQNKSYQQKACLNKCQQKLTIENCEFISLQLLSYGNNVSVPLCVNKTQID